VLAFVLALALQSPPPPPRPPPQTIVLLDDRVVKDQAPGAFLTRVAEEIGLRKSLRVVRISDARKRLDARGEKTLAGCADEAGCLASTARAVGADLVVTVRLTRREDAYFLAITRISALRPQMSDDAATLAGTDADALKFVAEGIGELFPGEQIGGADSRSTSQTQ
jgi:hypothetical protein